jgi:magnesium transporter
MSVPPITINGVTWYHFEQPGKEELLKLQEMFSFHDLDIEDCLSENERPKLEEHEDYLFCVFHVPVKSNVSGRIIKADINVFLGKDYIVTLSDGQTDAIAQLRTMLEQSPDAAETYFEEGAGFFLYKLLDLLFDRGFPLIEALMKDLRRMEVELFEHEDRQVKILRTILTLKRNIITMRSMLFPQRSVIVQLQHRKRELISDDLSLYFDDVSDAIERQWSLLDTAKEMSEVLQDSHESSLTHRTNEIIRLLTIFSVTMVPLTFIASLYGMNVGLPFQDDPRAFGIIASAMGTIFVILLGYFAWRKWL